MEKVLDFIATNKLPSGRPNINPMDYLSWNFLEIACALWRTNLAILKASTVKRQKIPLKTIVNSSTTDPGDFASVWTQRGPFWVIFIRFYFIHFSRLNSISIILVWENTRSAIYLTFLPYLMSYLISYLTLPYVLPYLTIPYVLPYLTLHKVRLG